MGRFGMWFQRLMYGRYGTDNLNKFIITITFVCIILNFFVHTHSMRLLIVALLIIAYCRMFSRNFHARARENEKYLELTEKFRKTRHTGSYSSGTGGYSSYTSYSGPRPKETTAKVDKTHRVLRCPACSGKLRVPKGVGKINITCPHCNLKFVKKV